VPPLRIGVDAACWPNRRGYGRFTRGLVGALAQREDLRLTLVADRHTAALIAPPPGVELLVVRTSAAAGDAASASGRRTVLDLLRCGLATSRAGFDVVFFPSVSTYFPLLSPTPEVVTIHDAIPERLPSLVFPRRRLQLYWTLKVRWALRVARRVITVSPFAARQLCDQFRLPEQRVRVVGEAPDPIFAPVDAETIAAVLGDYDLTQPYLLFVGGLSPHKDVPTLLRATYRLSREVAGLQLALAGEVDEDRFYTEPVRLRGIAEALGIAERVRWLGYVPDRALAALYSGATAVILPSLAEGFGLPVVEAAACGSPVVASDRSNAAEVIPAARVFPAGDDAALAAAVRPLFDAATRREVGERSREQAASYRWEEAAARAAAVFHEVAR
jgi:glycosyltransferase involved in cell wall biosynthesis